MSKKRKSILTKLQEKKLQEAVNDMLEIAADVVEEYNDIDLSNLSEISSSLDNLNNISNITQIHQDSPFLDEIFKGDAWKKVIKNIPIAPKNLEEDKEDDIK